MHRQNRSSHSSGRTGERSSSLSPRIHLMMPKTLPGAIAAALLFTSSVSAQTVTFVDTAPGAKPKDFESALTGNGKTGQWQVVEDATAEAGRALAQLNADRTD